MQNANEFLIKHRTTVAKRCRRVRKGKWRIELIINSNLTILMKKKINWLRLTTWNGIANMLLDSNYIKWKFDKKLAVMVALCGSTLPLSLTATGNRETDNCQRRHTPHDEGVDIKQSIEKKKEIHLYLTPCQYVCRPVCWGKMSFQPSLEPYSTCHILNSYPFIKYA